MLQNRLEYLFVDMMQLIYTQVTNKGNKQHKIEPCVAYESLYSIL